MASKAQLGNLLQVAAVLQRLAPEVVYGVVETNDGGVVFMADEERAATHPDIRVHGGEIEVQAPRNRPTGWLGVVRKYEAALGEIHQFYVV